MQTAFEASGRAQHMQFWGVYSGADILNFCLPSFLLVLGDANMYQRFAASATVKGARRATLWLVAAVAVVEALIILTSWISSSLIVNASNGRHVLIFAAHEYLPPLLGAVMLTTIVGIIISTADSYLLVPATTLIRDIYLIHVNKDANEKHVVLMSRLMVLALGVLAYFVSLGFAESATFFE